MCQTIVVNNCNEANKRFAELLAEDDLEGALGVAQVLWGLCDNEASFEEARGGLLGELIRCAHGLPRRDLDDLGLLIRGLRFDHSDEYRGLGLQRLEQPEPAFAV